MKITWYAHSCFLLTDENGVKILTDPCDPSVGYTLSGIECDAVTVSHSHFDHCYTAAAAGDPVIIREVGEYDVNGVKVTGFPSFHDDAHGAKRGSNIMFLFEMDGIRLLHAGDICALPAEEELNAIGPVDVLLVPVGGKYTLDYSGARELANLLKPSVVIPMHYKTPALNIDIDDCAKFVASAQDCSIHKLNDCEANIYKNTLGEDRVLVLDPKGA